MTSFATVRANAAAALATANKTHDAVIALLDSPELANWPADVAQAENVYNFGYCADGSLEFKAHTGALKTLLDLLKPVDLVQVEGSNVTTKPASHIRAEDLEWSDVYPLAPVVFKGDKTKTAATWWSRLSTGALVQVSAYNCEENSAGDWIPPAPGGSVNYATGHTYFTYRALRDLSEVAKLSSLSLWSKEWVAFGAQQGFSQHQLSVLNVLRQCCAEGTLEGRRAQFGSIYSTEQADVVWAYIDEMDKKLAALKPDTEKEVELVSAAIRELLAKGVPNSKAETQRYYLQHLAEKSGIQVKMLSVHKMVGGKGLEVYFQFQRSDDQLGERISYSTSPRYKVELLAGSYADKALRVQDLSVTYAD